MSRCRAERRRQQRNAARGCLTVGDAARLDEDRRLPNDYPSIVRARRKEGLSEAQLDQLRSEVIRVRWEEGHPILMAVRRSPEFKRLQTKMQDHPGPQSRLAPDLLMAAVILAVEQHNLAWRSIVCQIINGTDARLWHEARMCDHQTRGDPISFSTTIRQLERLELFTSGVARNEHKPHRKESTNGATSGDQPKEWPTPGLRRLISDILAATIPKQRLKRATAISIDQTDFESFYVPHQRLKQAEADRAVAEALANGDDPPDDFQLGPDGKLIRCADIHARGGHRSATATRKAGPFTGYMATIAVLVRSATWSGRPTKCRLGPEVPPYICSLSVDPATDSVGPIGERVVSDALGIVPNLREVLADRGFTQLGEAFNRPVHRLGLDVVMDMKSDEAQRTRPVEAGPPHVYGTKKWPQSLHLGGGALFPTWMPWTLKHLPNGLIGDYRKQKCEDRARWRWAPVQRLPDGSIQFRCPQCAGRVVTNLTTHAKLVLVARSAPETAVVGGTVNGECCEGLTVVPVEALDYWQRIPWGTSAWWQSYGRRVQVENVNGMLKEKGRLSNLFCRARGLGAHLIATLALAIAHNIDLTKTDPLAAKTQRDSSADSDASGGDSPAADAENSTDDDTGGDEDPLRAPP